MSEIRYNNYYGCIINSVLVTFPLEIPAKALYPYRLFPCGMCSCSLVTRHTDNLSLFCIVGTSYGYGHSSKTNVHCLYGASQGINGTCHKGTANGYRALQRYLCIMKHRDTSVRQNVVNSVLVSSFLIATQRLHHFVFEHQLITF